MLLLSSHEKGETKGSRMSTDPTAVSNLRVIAPESWRKELAPLTGESPDAPGAVESLPLRTPSPVETAAALLRGRFTALVIWHLFWGGKRFYQLVRELPGVPRKALAHELEELERAGIVARRVQHRGQARIEYRLTPLGERFKIVVGAMYEWGLLAGRPFRRGSGALGPASGR